MHRYAEGTLGNVEQKPKEFLIQINICHELLCRKNHRICCKKKMEFLMKINMLHASLC